MTDEEKTLTMVEADQKAFQAALDANKPSVTGDTEVHDAFTVHLLNDQGISAARQLAGVFTDCMVALEALIPPGRELAIVKTKLQEASFFAKRAIAQSPSNQK